MTRRTILALAIGFWSFLAAAAQGRAVQGTVDRPDDWRALAVASFDDAWQTIQDSFPDPAFGGLDWRGVRDELRPRVERAVSRDAAREVMREMLRRLGRSHFELLSPDAAEDTLPGDARVPIDVRVAGDRILVTRVHPSSPAEAAGVRAGAVVLAVDDQETASWFGGAPGAADRARVALVWRRVNRALHGTAGSEAALRLRAPDGRITSVRVARTRPAGVIVQFGNLPPLSVDVDTREVRTPAGRRAGLIGFTIWLPAINDRVEAGVDRFRAADGLIIDLRGNPGGIATMMGGIAGHLLATDALLGTMRTRQTLDEPLSFRANPRRSTADGRRVEPFAGPVAILVDELTASTSECFAGGLQSLGRARIFGRPTAGQALPALTRRLPNGDVLMYAIGDFVTSTGQRLEAGGVVPDEIQPLDIEALAAGGDATLEAAIRWIDRAAGSR